MIDEKYELLSIRLDKNEAQLESLDSKYVDRQLLEERAASQGKRIGDLELQVRTLEERWKWMMRLVVGGVVIAVLAAVTEGFLPI